MKQQNEPNTVHRVIYTIQAPNEHANLKDGYSINAVTALGVIHIICGFIALVAEIAGLVSGSFPKTRQDKT